ncbi:MAG TPA: glycosyltransferase family A protein [Croceibacterium sp.]|nr:glycosyltransferase family A protein [Croceibacterium sp.]
MARKKATASRPDAPAPAPAIAPTIAFVTTCRGRLHHLKQTLPAMAAQAPDELIVVDYGCPDGTGDWVETNFPAAKVVRASQPDGGFNVSRARNLGAAEAASDWLFFIDADVTCQPGLGEWLRGALEAGKFYRPVPGEGPPAHQVFGSFACAAADFARAEGFDEVIEGWGYEDRDMYQRLGHGGVAEAHYPSGLVTAILHANDERHLLPDLGNRWQNWTVNACYAEAKQKISLFRGGTGNLPLQDRRALRQQTGQIVRKWIAGGAGQQLQVKFTVRRDEPQRLIGRMHVRSEWTLTVIVHGP